MILLGKKHKKSKKYMCGYIWRLTGEIREESDMVDLRANPFFLNDDQIRWVEQTLASLDLEDKIGQMFCPIGGNTEEGFLKSFTEEFRPGAMLYRPMPAAEAQKVHAFLQKCSKVPMLFGANLESGGNGIAADGTYYARPMSVAASDNPENAYNLGAVAGREAAAVGCNWAFSPICDIDMN